MDYGGDKIGENEVRAQLRRVLSSPDFEASRRNTDFLTYVVERFLEDRPELINGYQIGVNVFDKGIDFDPQTDPIVRTQAVRLRNALKRYYYEQGADDPLKIEIPRGSYVPKLRPTGGASAKESHTAVDKHARSDQERPLDPVIAVLPFQDLSPDHDQEHLALGIAEELSLSLTNFEGFSVISSQSAQVFKDKMGDIRKISSSLGASFILHGSVRRSENHLRIIAEVLDGSSGAILWAERFDRDLTAENLFEIQDAITSEVVSKVADHYGVIPRQLSEVSMARRTDNFSSYETLLLAYSYSNTGSADRHRKAKALLEKATERDPRYAPLWAQLSELTTDEFVLWCNWDENLLDRALTCSNEAVSLDPRYQYGYFTKAYAHFFRGEDKEFMEVAEKTLALNPNAAFVTGFTGFLMALAGHWERGLEIMERSKTLNPFRPGWFHLATCFHALNEGRLEDAYSEAVKMRSPSIPWDPLLRSACLALLGRNEEAGHAVEELCEIRPELIDAEGRRKYIRLFVKDQGLADKVFDALPD